jgi:hypothetical protein
MNRAMPASLYQKSKCKKQNDRAKIKKDKKKDGSDPSIC